MDQKDKAVVPSHAGTISPGEPRQVQGCRLGLLDIHVAEGEDGAHSCGTRQQPLDRGLQTGRFLSVYCAIVHISYFRLPVQINTQTTFLIFIYCDKTCLAWQCADT